MQQTLLSVWLTRLTALGLLIAVGCNSSDRSIVTGTVLRTDGSPVAGARVIFRSPSSGESANGTTNQEGFYKLGTVEHGDGIPPGDYGIMVLENRGDWDNPKPPTIATKYESAKTSGLTFTVEPNSRETCDLKLDRTN